jgi:hypothetical protein
MYPSKRSALLGLVSFFCALSAFSQVGVASVDQDGRVPSPRDEQTAAVPVLAILEPIADAAANPVLISPVGQRVDSPSGESQEAPSGDPGAEEKIQPSDKTLKASKPPDFNQEIYYRNKLEFSLNVGWLPINIPFPLDIFVGDAYNTYPLKYTLVPVFASLRWQIDSVGSPWILRGNWDMTFTGSVTAIPRGPESRYFSYLMGIRRNFVQRNWRVAPYFDVRLGVGTIDAKGPEGVLYAQGQNITFTINIGSGVRYNFNPRYAISAGLNFMHISNLDLSESNGKPNWGVRNYGINVYGPMVGLEVQLRRHRRHSE